MSVTDNMKEEKIIDENLSESLDDIALNNLSLLVKDEKNSFTNNRFILQKNKMIENNDENIDVVYSLNDLENTLYFTFNHCMGILRKSETDVFIMLHSLFNALDIVEEYYNERKDTSLHLENIIDDIQCKLMEHKNNYYNRSICSRFIKDFGNKIHRILLDASKEVFQFYWHYHSFDAYSDDETDNELNNKSENESENESENDSEDNLKDKEC